MRRTWELDSLGRKIFGRVVQFLNDFRQFVELKRNMEGIYKKIKNMLRRGLINSDTVGLVLTRLGLVKMSDGRPSW
jgi:hypothetical protein